MKTAISVVAVAAVLLAGVACGERDKSWKGETATLARCLKMAERTVQRSIRVLTTDRPDYVAGYLGPGRKYPFNCTRKVTGTRGVYWEGWVHHLP